MTVDYQRLEKNLAREFRQYHVAAQVYRVAFVFAGALSLQLKDGWHDWTWKGLYALGLAVGYATLKHFLPTVSWKLVLDQLRAARSAAEQKDTAGAVQAAAPTAEQVYTPVSGSEPAPPGLRADTPTAP